MMPLKKPLVEAHEDNQQTDRRPQLNVQNRRKILTNIRIKKWHYFGNFNVSVEFCETKREKNTKVKNTAQKC